MTNSTVPIPLKLKSCRSLLLMERRSKSKTRRAKEQKIDVVARDGYTAKHSGAISQRLNCIHRTIDTCFAQNDNVRRRGRGGF